MTGQEGVRRRNISQSRGDDDIISADYRDSFATIHMNDGTAG
jgi:hypothetical protein